jgi:hypothetical protein
LESGNGFAYCDFHGLLSFIAQLTSSHIELPLSLPGNCQIRDIDTLG